MSTNPMQPMPDDGDPGDEQAGYKECQEDITELQKWAAQVGAKVGVPFSPDTDDQTDSLSDAIQGNANPFRNAKSL